MKRWNINRGFKKLRVWRDAISLYRMSSELLSDFPFEFKKTSANVIDAAHSISRNIAEGYGRRSLNEYLQHLNYALGSSAELHSSMVSFLEADQIQSEDFEKFDSLHYKMENGLLKLVKSLEAKQERGDVWNHVLSASRSDASAQN